MSVARIVIMAGGTGGHVYPALAVARLLRERGWVVSWMGTEQGLEARVAPENGFELDCIRVRSLRGRGLRGWLLLPWRLVVALRQAGRILRSRRPDIVLGMGGYAAGPGGVAAALRRIPLVIHEQNAAPGLTNRILARLARRVLAGFTGSFPPARRAEVVGNPVRRELLESPDPATRMADRQGPVRVLILGGSQGARALNQQVPAMLRQLPPDRIQVRHQCGAGRDDEARAAWGEHGPEVSVEPFIEDMRAAWEWADLAICRAGALTVAELAAVGVAAVLVPLPHAADDHQTRNATWLERAGAARLVPQERLGEEGFRKVIEELTGDRRSLQEMASRARALSRPDADRRVADICAGLVGASAREDTA